MRIQKVKLGRKKKVSTREVVTPAATAEPPTPPSTVEATAPEPPELAPATVKGRDKRNIEKWGQTAWKSGWMAVPSVLITHQARLGLEPSDLNVLLHLIARWWDPNRKPYLGKKEMAEAMGGVSLRTVQRSLSRLRNANLIVQHPRLRFDGSHTTPEYDLSGLVGRLNQLAQEELTRRTTAAHSAQGARTRRGLRIKAPPKERDGDVVAA
ncbi:helix-turn-helix domain-containing protein [Corallococcus exiguus]|uniref:Helix-turn-helix domain-containing protein n=1 Tax=Corallococcus exiguus TaxID=83462 RepID=A0A7X4YHK2_9BACT|nr:helix-turn-helix domain-containing protein [Corallococcus exiguus]NBC44824.1 helix-turn-helix domain-containing protein [Corallococcus exiguus]TNV66198.1 helix-turn-helix domain-containing protein [Corallococcus exiguus]